MKEPVALWQGRVWSGAAHRTKMLLRGLQLAAAVGLASAHGAMQYPPTWLDPGGQNGSSCGWGASGFNAGV
eukprot:SAG31_NODE_36419_length_313_cov_1.172897_1_plen_70_part_10